MRVLVLHNSYLQRGGEDVVADAETELLRTHGNEVAEYRVSNTEVATLGAVRAAVRTVFSTEAVAAVERLITSFRPDVIHAHNTFPLISPAVFRAAQRKQVAAVQTLHNFRLVCPSGLLLRDGKVCELCLGRVPWPAVKYSCYRGSRLASGTVASMLVIHRLLRTYSSSVQRLIALTEFGRRKFIEGGLPEAKIDVKPNFVVDDGRLGDGGGDRSGGLFVGRLSPEKGLEVLATAVALVDGARVDVIGQGTVGEGRTPRPERIRYLGWKPASEVRNLMRERAYLIIPSIWYETFGLVGVEAFACGLPVIAARLGALQELVEDGVTGLLFEPGSPQDLARKIAWAEANPTAMQAMGLNARREYEAKYTPERNYAQLMAIYHRARADQERLRA